MHMHIHIHIYIYTHIDHYISNMSIISYYAFLAAAWEQERLHPRGRRGRLRVTAKE